MDWFQIILIIVTAMGLGYMCLAQLVFWRDQIRLERKAQLDSVKPDGISIPTLTVLDSFMHALQRERSNEVAAMHRRIINLECSLDAADRVAYFANRLINGYHLKLSPEQLEMKESAYRRALDTYMLQANPCWPREYDDE